MTRRLSPEFYARELSHNLEIKNVPVDPWEICEELDIKVCYEPFKQCEALLCIKNGRKKIILNENIPYYLRHKFSLAHEIGHYWMCFLQEKIPHFCKDFSPGTGGEFFC
jgi:Zn-dependent peptidase ImmA (M78 family)